MNRTKQTHTPGPWTVLPDEQRGTGGERIFKVCRNGRQLGQNGLIADVSAWWVDTESAEANARLIAEAPAMRETLQALVEWAQFTGGWESSCWDDARAILARIEGGGDS